MVRRSTKAGRLKDKLRKRQLRAEEKKPFVFFPVERTHGIQELNHENIATELAVLPQHDQLVLQLTPPRICRSIIPDGNCFFRSLSYGLTGTEDNYAQIRRMICDFMRTNPDKVVGFLPLNANNDVGRYLQMSHMENNAVWATENEIQAACIMLQTNIFLYTKSGRTWKWLRHSPFDSNPDNGLYLFHKNRNHFDVVVAIQNTVVPPEMNDDNLYNFQELIGAEVQAAKTELDNAYYKTNENYRKRKLQTQRDEYTNPFVSEKIKQKGKERYANPVVSDRKKKAQKGRYADPVVSDRKKTTQKKRYADPVVSDRKKTTQKKRYADPVVSDKKKTTQKDRYADPVVSDKKKRTQKDRYADPVVSDRKKTTQKESYADPIVSDRKKRTQKERYANPVASSKKKKAQKRLYATSPTYAIRKKNMQKQRYASDHEFASKQKAYTNMRYHSDPSYRKKLKLASMIKYSTNPRFRNHLKQLSKSRYASDIEFRHLAKASSIKRYAGNPLFRVKLKSFLKSQYHRNTLLQEKKKARVKAARKRINCAVKSFRKCIQDTPQYVCKVCIRLLYRAQVLKLKEGRYTDKKTKKMSNDVEKCLRQAEEHICTDTCSDNCWSKFLEKDQLWICHTCNRHLKSGNMPPQALANKMVLSPIPPELARLNILERQLVSLRIPFMKLLSLPRGGQKGVKGPVVNVPSDITSTTDALPRNIKDAQMIKVKLKRKTSYKGHYTYSWINPIHIVDAIRYLKENNIWYRNVIINNGWLSGNNDPELLQPHSYTIEDSDSQSISTDVSDTEVENKSHDRDAISTQDNDIHLDESDPNAVFESDSEQNENHENQDNKNCQNQDKQSKRKCKEDTIEEETTNSLGFPVDTCFQPIDLGQEMLDTNTTLCLAPGENQSPKNIFQEEGSEAMAFSTLLPDGHFGLSEKRDVKLPPGKYFNARLFSADSRFATNKEYIFFAQYVTEIDRISSNVSLALRKGKQTTQDGKPVTASMLIDSESIHDILKTDVGFRFLQPIRGSPPYWQKTMKELFSMINQLGIPTWFVTFSAAESRWPEVMITLLYLNNDDRDPDELEWSEKCSLIADNPVICARMFDQRVKALFRELIMSPSQPLGEVQDYFFRTEFQQRGSPHIHCLLWIKGAPKLDKDPDDIICQFIDNFITCQMPDPNDDPELYDIISTVQVHNKAHGKSCKKYNTTCRFNFPRQPIRQTFIARIESVDNQENNVPTEAELNEMSRKAALNPKQILKDVWSLVSIAEEYNYSFSQILKLLNITYDDYTHCLKEAAKRNTVYHKRRLSDVWVNNYNKTLSRAWNANLDIQYVTDAYACVAYILSYISKAETEIGDLLKNAQEEAKDGNADAASALRKIGSVYLQNREVSAQEAIYRVCSLHLKHCTREVMFIPAGSNIFRMSLPVSAVKSRSQQDGDDENIWMISIHERYYARPLEHEFQSLSLAEFVSKYIILPKSRKPKPSDSVFELQNDLGFIRRRQIGKEAVIRYPKFNKEKQSEDYYLSLAQLFLPHRSPIVVPEDCVSFEDFVMNNTINEQLIIDIIEENRKRFEIDSEDLEKAWQDVQEGNIQENAWGDVAPETEKERLEDCMEKNDDSLDNEQEEIPELRVDNNKAHNSAPYHYEAPRVSDQEINAMLRKMNETQKQVFYSVRSWCLKVVRNEKPEPFHVFLTGGAGTGKSHVIGCIFHTMTKILSKTTTTPDDVSVLLTAPTGTAAFNIQGMTVHSAFGINKKVTLPYQPLGENLLNTLRSKFEQLRILIIDEVSMVDQKILIYVHGRLSQIKHTKKPFGDVSILAVGDFYQLPPVRGLPLYKQRDQDFVDLWNSHFSIVMLTEIMRQKDDRLFADMLNRIRVHIRGNQLQQEDRDALVNISRQTTPDEAFDALHIFPTNQEVNIHNSSMICKVCNIRYTSVATDFATDIVTGRMRKKDQPYATCTPEDLQTEIQLGIGARVMLTRNISTEDGLVNGAFGTVSGVDVDPSGQVIAVYIRFDNNNVGQKQIKQQVVTQPLLKGSVRIKPVTDALVGKKATRKQLPLKLAWAATIHKVQGMTVDKIVVSLKKIFQPGMAYVGLSRARTLQGLHILDFNEQSIYCSSDITDALQRMPQYIQSPPASDPTDFVIVHHNVQGLIPHLDDIKSITEFENADVFCLSETWLTENQIVPVRMFRDFILYHKTRSKSYGGQHHVMAANATAKGGGVAIFITRHCLHRELKLQTKNIEAIGALVNNLIVVAVYRPQSYPLVEFQTTLTTLLQEIRGFSHPAVIVGDFNVDVLNSKESLLCRTFRDFGYAQLVDFPTTEGGTCLDLVFVSSVDKCEVNVVPTFFSYHDAVKLAIH